MSWSKFWKTFKVELIMRTRSQGRRDQFQRDITLFQSNLMSTQGGNSVNDHQSPVKCKTPGSSLDLGVKVKRRRHSPCISSHVKSKDRSDVDDSHWINLAESVQNHPLLEATFLKRPSARNKSPYVADVKLEDGRIALAHAPALDLGGKCVPGVKVLLKVLTEKDGSPIGDGAVSAKHGTPRCEFSIQSVFCIEPENEMLGGVWIGANPQIGEKVAKIVLEKGLLFDDLVKIESQMHGVFGMKSRPDFVVTHSNGNQTVVEVKMVVDSDYSMELEREKVIDSCFMSQMKPYKRCAIFPWGKGTQKGPDGEKVVSSRAIKHVMELTEVCKSNASVNCAILFIVVRHDCEYFRPNTNACPSFTQYLRIASQNGVLIKAFSIKISNNATISPSGFIPVLNLD